uniref:HAT C-terminal dimerisation domain-containing protein n=1 Tax=Denticeps clupeoides TaxID=299321 RepID=A0AAY4BWE5_9TELE
MVDITDLLNTLNIQLQGKDQIITELFDHITAFRSKLQLLCRHLSAGNLAHFPSLREVNLVKQRLPEYVTLLRHLDQDFALRFEDFRESGGDMELFSQNVTISVDSVPDHIQMQLIEFQCDSELKNKFMSLHLKDFYTRVSSESYPGIRKHAQVMLALFGSSYICEQTFTDILTLSVSQLQPNIDRLINAKEQLHVSH